MAQKLSTGLARVALAVYERARPILPMARREALARPGFTGFLEKAESEHPGVSTLVVRGWVLPDLGEVTGLRVTVGGFPCGALRTGLSRPDVERLFPDRPDAARCGFEGRFAPPEGLHGAADLIVWADLAGGAVAQGFVRCVTVSPIPHVPLSAETPAVSVSGPPSRSTSDDLARHGMADLLLARAIMQAPPVEPECSVVIPVFNEHLLTYRCLRAVLTAAGTVAFEVIVVDNGSTDDTRRLLECFGPSVRVLRFPDNRGFVHACNAGAEAARGTHVVFLNNDTEVTDGWLDRLVATTRVFQDVGAVGGMLVYPDGSLQEAGGIVFADGSAANHGHRCSPLQPEFRYAREVDYCSAACLLVRRDVFQRLGGFDARYAPAYYEDVDLCFAVRKTGCKVMYQPLCRVVHLEGGTAGTDVRIGLKRYQQINRDRFAEKWRSELAEQRPAGTPEAEPDRRTGPRFLVIEHQLPHTDEDAGSVRAFAIVRLLVQQGCRVSFLLREGQDFDRHAEALGAVGVRVVPEDQAFDLLAGGAFDVVIAARVDMAAEYVPRVRRAAPGVVTVFDTVDLHWVREFRAAELLDDPSRRAKAEQTRASECSMARQCDHTVVATETDRAHLLELVPQAQVSVIPTIHEPVDGELTVAGRTRLVFVGGFAHEPNVDAALFLVREVWPLIRAAIPAAALDIIGSHPPGEVAALATDGVRVTGYVPGLAPYYRQARVALAPLRFGAGMKGKVAEAMAFGVPVITTTVGAEGIGLVHGETALIADSPQAIATAVASIFRDDDRWHRLARQGQAFVRASYSPTAVLPAVRRLMALSHAGLAAGSKGKRP